MKPPVRGKWKMEMDGKIVETEWQTKQLNVFTIDWKTTTWLEAINDVIQIDDCITNFPFQVPESTQNYEFPVPLADSDVAFRRVLFDRVELTDGCRVWRRVS